DEERHERRQTWVISQQGLEDVRRAGGRQGVEPQLRVIRLAAPAVLVFRTVVDQQQHASRGQALDQRLKERLRLWIDPVQVFEDQQQWLYLAFAQQYALEGLQRALAPLRRLELLKRAVLREDVQQGEERGERLLQRLVERQHLPSDLGADGARLI